MDRPYDQTLSLADLELLGLVEKGGASPREVDEALGMGRRETAAVFRDLMRRGLLDWDSRTRALDGLAHALAVRFHHLPAHAPGAQPERG